MTPTTQEVFQAALSLAEEDRLELAEALLASKGRPEGPPFDPAWLSEARRRFAEIESGAVQPASWPEVRERARRRLEGQRRPRQ